MIFVFSILVPFTSILENKCCIESLWYTELIVHLMYVRWNCVEKINICHLYSYFESFRVGACPLSKNK